MNIAELRRLEAKRPWDINDIDAVRNALPELLKVLEWQDISTAPKDGTAVDLWMEYGSRETDFHMDDKGRWVRKEGYPTFTRVLLSKPAAWRPLPLPPHGGVDV